MPRPRSQTDGVSLYTPELAERVADAIATSECSLRKLYEMHEWFPHRDTLHHWRKRHPEFDRLYVMAKQAQAETLAEAALDYILAIDDSQGRDSLAMISKAREVAQHMRWLAEKFSPKTFGLHLNVAGVPGQPIEVKHELHGADRAAEIAGVLDQAGALAAGNGADEAPTTH